MESCNLFTEGSHASRSARGESDLGKQTSDTSGRKCSGLCEKESRIGLLRRMLLTSPAWHSTTCSLTWKVKATKHGRLYHQLVPSTLRTAGTGYGLLPTLQASDATSGQVVGANDRYTVTKSGTLRRHTQTGRNCSLSLGRLTRIVGGVAISPCAGEWLMGFPLGWTDCAPSATQ